MLLSDMDVDQIIELVKRLPDDKKQRVLRELAREAREKRAKLMEKAQRRIRILAAERGLDWDAMDDEQRLQFIDDLIHEDRECI